MDLPRITIVTPCFNGARYIGEAVESLRRQAYPDLEHIVMDAGSIDGTLALLGGFPDIRVVSEPDEGAHDAMNKGIALARGDVIGFLNTDDLYPDGLLLAVGRAFAEDPALDVAVGGSIVFQDGEGGRRVVVARRYAAGNGFSLAELAFGAPGINGRFFRRRVFEQVGTFDNRYYIAADRDFLLRVAFRGCAARNLGRIGIHYRLHSDSATINAERRQLETITREHVRMSRELVTKRSGVLRRRLLAWHAFEAIKLAWICLQTGRPGEASRVLIGLGLRHPFLPFHVARGLFMRRGVRRTERRDTATLTADLV